MINQQERRMAYRIDTLISFILSQQAFTAENKTATSPDLLQAFWQIDRHHQPLWHELQQQMPQLAQYLKGMQRKIELIAESLAPDAFTWPAARPLNLSATGFALDWPDPFTVGDTLYIKLRLPDTQEEIQARAEVVHHKLNQPNKEARETHSASYRLACRFIDLATEYEQALVRFVWRQELAQSHRNTLEWSDEPDKAS